MLLPKRSLLICLLTFVVAFVACNPGGSTSSSPSVSLQGAGATFPNPLYQKWLSEYGKLHPNVKIDYQSIGSGGGVQQLKGQTVDFGASDSPMKDEDLKAAPGEIVHIPTVLGAVVITYNLAGINQPLKFSPEVVADIFLGKIKKWNDPKIAADNSGVTLPATDITVVHRSDGSGTSAVFTDYLSKVSPEWKSRVGSSTAVAWPEGVGGKGNEGVAAYVQRIKGAIGYVEYAYAKRNRMTHASVRNRDGQFVQPDDATFKAAAANADWKNAPGFYQILTDQPGRTAWPITGASFILMHVRQDKPQNAAEVLKFFDWSFRNGQKLAEDLDYVPLPDAVVTIVEDAWKTQIGDGAGKAVWH